MAASAKHNPNDITPPVTCVADGGCSYLRALAAIEHLAGFERTARSYAVAAARCRQNGCWAAKGVPRTLPAARGPAPIPLSVAKTQRGSSAVFATVGGAQTIPFLRSALVEHVSDSAGNYVERHQLKLETLPGKRDPLGYLYDYWRMLRAATECQFSNIDTVHLRRAGIIGKLHVVDVSSNDPLDFRFELFGYALALGRQEKPRAHPVTIFAESTLRDYNTVRLTAAPRLHRIRCRLGDTDHHYTRLILPFLNEAGSVNRLLVAIREEPGNAIKIKPSH